MDKLIRSAKALKAEAIRRLPYIFIVLVLVFGAELIKLNYKTAEGVQLARGNTANSRLLLEKVARLSEDNRELSQQNNQLAHTNAAHIDCIAKLFAQFTHDQKPITITDLNTCEAVIGEAPATTPAPTIPKADNNKNLPTAANKNRSSQPLQPTSTPPASEPGVIQGGPVCLLLICLQPQVL